MAQWQKKHAARTDGKWENTNEHDAKWWRDNAQGWEIRALYTSPQPAQRTWVGLTDGEVADCIKFPGRNLFARDGTTSQQIARAIEAKLKEKNNG